MDENIRRSGQYCQYNQNLPLFLQERPQKFTKHCIERLTSANAIEIKDITKDEFSQNTYNVNSATTKGECHRIYLGDEDSIPSCSCIDWKKNLLPCKHMLAVITKINSVTWDSVSKKYRDSPFLKLDNEIIAPCELKSRSQSAVNTQINANIALINDIPKKAYSSRTKASRCRELLTQVKSATFLVDNADVLDTLEKNLERMVQMLHGHEPKEDSLSLRQPEKNQIEKFKNYKKLPCPKKRKSELTGRVGESTEKRRKSSTLKITSALECSLANEITEEVVVLDAIDEYNVNDV